MRSIAELIPGFTSKTGIVPFDNSFDLNDAIAVVKNPNARTLQTDQIISDNVWSLINEVVLAARDDIRLRIFRFYSAPRDLSFLKHLTNVKSLSVDTGYEAINVEYIAQLPNLTSLRLDVYHLESFNFLSTICHQLKDLSLGRTRSKKPDLNFLHNFSGLEKLRICGHTKNIDILGDLEKLSELSLSGITINNFDFINQLQRLVSLNIGLVKCANFYSLENQAIKSISISEIRNMDDVSFISSLQSIQEISISDLNKVTNFPRLDSRHSVRRIFIDNMKSLSDIRHIFECENLVDFIFRNRSTQLLPKDFQPITTLKKIKYASIGTGSTKKNRQINDFLEKANISPYKYYDFIYT